MADALRPLWDFDDLETTERRFRALQAEVLTQRARVEGLREDFDAGERVLVDAEALAGDDPAALARIAMERGRLKRSSGDLAAALPLFEHAFEIARAAGLEFLAVDAAHMAALAADELEEWTQRGIELAEASSNEQVRYWLGPLYNNLGWARFEAEQYDVALDAFERALAARERDLERPREIAIARYAVAKALRALGRLDEARAELEQALAWAESVGERDPYFDEELAEIDAAQRV